MSGPAIIGEVLKAWADVMSYGYVGIDVVRLANEPFDRLLRREIEIILDLQDDGFNPYGSGPEPIGPR